MREKLNNYIKENGVKATWVAEKLGISKQYLNNYLKGRTEVSNEVHKRMREFLRERGVL